MCWSDSIALGNLEPSKPWLIKTTAFEQFIEDRFGFFPDVPSGDSVFQHGVKVNAFSLVEVAHDLHEERLKISAAFTTAITVDFSLIGGQ